MAVPKIFQRRAGVATPLFSVQSKNSVGVGEFRDLELLADWCRLTGLSIIQLLPMNDVGFDFRPYDSQSSIALDPMHLSLERIAFIPSARFASEIQALKKLFPRDSFWFDTSVKKQKLKVLRRMFLCRTPAGQKAYERYRSANGFWLEDYALFKVIKEQMNGARWEAWPEALRNREKTALEAIRGDQKEALEFETWIQWQIFMQFSEAARAVKKKGIFLMGDLPFLVSRDSADVWSRPGYFKRHLSAGAPPDLVFAGGQEWGMPPYDWEALKEADYDYLTEKLKYAENFYDLFRIDHFVGLFRLWTFPVEGPEAERKKAGAFDPPEEKLWEAHGERILSVILAHTSMKPCAEDLGSVPECSARVLERHQVPGMEIQRWARDWGKTGDFFRPEQYRTNSIVTLSTHDMAPFMFWWEKETSPEEKEKFWRAIGFSGKAPSRGTRKLLVRALETAGAARSIFSIQLFQDWLALGGVMGKDNDDKRINRPGIVHEKNWRLRAPIFLEDMKALPLNKTILAINKKTKRC